MSHDNLPTWPGASTVYDRVNAINTALCRAAYLAAKPKRPTRLTRSGTWTYTVPAEVRASIEALGNGDEEALKAYVQSHLSLIFPPTA